MNKDTFLWLSLGIGVGMLVAAAWTYNAIVQEKKKREDPRLAKAESLLDEAEELLRAAKKGKPITHG